MDPFLSVWPAMRAITTVVISALLLVSPALVSAQSATRPPAPAVPAAKPAAKPAADAKELVAVMDLDAVGASKIEASAMTDRLREELLKSGRFTLVDRSQMNAVLDEQALQQSGCTTQECAVQVGKVLGVRELISGKVTKISDTQWLVNVTMVDVETSETLRAESLRYQGNYFSMLDSGIVQLAAKLSTPVGQKPNLQAYLATQQATANPEQKPEEEKSSSKWWWIAGGVAVVAVAAAASGSSSKSSSSGSGGCGNCGKVNVGW